ncbi:MAG: DNA mismatch repair protein MutS, partial [Proteobacteria bacterium]|nr:DNA mismatch repair protein MutS [Pseudomonadota bacterium]
RVKPGAANQSYGLQVAKLAGIPRHAIELARQKLLLLEQQSKHSAPQIDLFSEPVIPPPAESPVVEKLSELDLDNLSPRQALDTLYHLKALLRDT